MVSGHFNISSAEHHPVSNGFAWFEFIHQMQVVMAGSSSARLMHFMFGTCWPDTIPHHLVITGEILQRFPCLSRLDCHSLNRPRPFSSNERFLTFTKSFLIGSGTLWWSEIRVTHNFICTKLSWWPVTDESPTLGWSRYILIGMNEQTLDSRCILWCIGLVEDGRGYRSTKPFGGSAKSHNVISCHIL